jgi:DNA polymerase-3 subunit epsilon
MSRAVLFDTETTGLDPTLGDRIIEIAAIELFNDLPTGRHFHTLLDPERDVPSEVVRVHGITQEMLRGKPRFADIADALLEFFGDSKLVAHNAAFDFAFLDAELARIGRAPLERARMVDTLQLAKAKFPGLPNNLDALCRRFGIDLSERTTHNALLDCRLLAKVYVELIGGRQRGLALVGPEEANVPAPAAIALAARTPRPIVVSDAEEAAHRAFLAKLKDPIWLQDEQG